MVDDWEQKLEPLSAIHGVMIHREWQTMVVPMITGLNFTPSLKNWT